VSRLLAIETSSEACSVALSINGETRERTFHEPRRHAELLLPAISELLAEAGTGLDTLDAVAFGRGPGSFTSLRIGIGVVQGLAWGAELGVVPVSSLATLAVGAANRFNEGDSFQVLAAMDARMNQVFCARFDFDVAGLPKPKGEEQVIDPSAVEMPDASTVVGAGNGFERYPELMQMSASFAAVYPDLWPSATDVITLALVWLEEHQPLEPHLAQPVYIRDDVAEKPVAPL
jgi:tRNA threonylcarbamoyladenosine biosynthesis protein TsaB